MRAIIAFAALIAIIALISYAGAIVGGCPDNKYGTGNKTIKYFSSPLCVACWTQKPIMERVALEGELSFEEYNVDFCRDAAAPNYIRGVPAFMTNDKVYYGLQNEEQLRNLA